MSLVGIVRDFGLKLVAITCAATLWLGVAGDPEAEQGLRVHCCLRTYRVPWRF